ncbi:MAG: fructose-6-phosphate aldolase [Acidobacteria bacterium]|nr:fructose-6-phosphate aldolase [Acidobacteriota bacterium]MDW7984521.1 fructose-6-phosphate aldolase [Acidobacteriota bacterium]
MRIFLDTANVDEIRRLAATGVIDGVTTNPTLLAQQGGDPLAVLKEICTIVQGDVSAEVVATQHEEMIAEARRLAALDPHIVVKIPMTAEGLRSIRVLSREGIRVNTTLIFTPIQALLAAKAGAYIVSPFVGRLDDIAHRGMQVIRQTVAIFRNYQVKTQVLVASIRHPLHVLEAARLGADIATMPTKVFEQLLKHPLTDIGLERFLKDWQSAGYGRIL